MSHKELDVSAVAVRLLGVKLPFGLTLDETILQGENLHFEKEPLVVQLEKPGTMEVRVGEASLAAFLNHKAPAQLTNLKVKLTEDVIRVDAMATMFISIPVAALCKLRIHEGRQLFVDLVKVEAIGGQSAHSLVQKQLDSINPVLDVEDLPLECRLSQVKIADAMVLLTGTIAPKAE